MSVHFFAEANCTSHFKSENQRPTSTVTVPTQLILKVLHTFGSVETLRSTFSAASALVCSSEVTQKLTRFMPTLALTLKNTVPCTSGSGTGRLIESLKPQSSLDGTYS